MTNNSLKKNGIDTVPVSVIVPCFNNADCLRECIDSVNLMTQPDEILIIDDKSTDDSLLVAQSLSGKFKNIRVLSRENNGGAAAARYDGILDAKHEWLAFVDADDYLEADAVASAYKRACDEDSDICIWDMWRVDAGRCWCDIPLRASDFPKTGRQAVIETLGGWRIHPMGVARKEIYLSAYQGFTETILNADELITRLVFANSRQISFCDRKYFYRVDPQSSTQKISAQRLTILRTHIWLLQFAKSYPEVRLDTIGAAAIAHAWRFLTHRKLYGTEAVNDALSNFLAELSKHGDLSKWLWRYPRHLVAFLCIYTAIKWKIAR